jgi:hypothetical protein
MHGCSEEGKKEGEKNPLGAAAEERVRAGPTARLGPGEKSKVVWFREEALGV